MIPRLSALDKLRSQVRTAWDAPRSADMRRSINRSGTST